MRQVISGLDFAPILPLWLLVALAVLAVLALVPAIWRRARGTGWRALSFLVLLLALSNPRLVEETRETRPDIALVVQDRSDSARIGPRAAQLDAARAAIEQQAARFPDLELRTIDVPESGRQGTRLFTAIDRALADIPRARLAGVIALTDGQAHDVPAQPSFAAPLHLLLPGQPGEVDRRIRVIEAPGYGIVGRTVELRVAVEDLGARETGGAVRLTLRRDGAPPRVESVPIGREHRIALPIERGGPSVVELTAEARPGEVSTLNNRAVVTVNGVRDRLRVLLVSGEPHSGERTWRRLLKADPNVDLVHFTILRPPEKDDLTPLNELALIAFPVRELFQVKLREFDLIVFDRFSNRGILPALYLRNIADYVRSGGALLLSVGPEFIGSSSLAATPLSAVLPARPLSGPSAVAEGPFRPRVTDVGGRHPVTEGLEGANAGNTEPKWGHWYRHLRTSPQSGLTVMDNGDGSPLLQLDRVGEGRVALLLSDQIWLWSRGHDGGGPQAELLRRAAHWLMKEPELEEEDLVATIDGGTLRVVRRSVEAGPPPQITVTAPDGSVAGASAEPAGGGRAVLEMPAAQPGVWQVSDGRRTAFAAAAAANPLEVADLRADAAPTRTVVEASAGSVHWLGTAAPPQLPELRRVALDRDAAGRNWIGLRRNQDHLVTGIAALPLLPPWLALPLVLGLALVAWRREGR
ncbi:hypothetical protein E0493_20395 [Roseomonas sp. M0104]|uniref:Glutamine amidotransferase domain-containing protein n=1 Tax=Teichococcus coralli TaxID=2545983 RepID=A0A845BI19_9PROT|nr:hypothetical protein [Pseudoroseomonas coralli]MXP65714.1 hypothetical protein [Pseudoroseomonas coralli]